MLGTQQLAATPTNVAAKNDVVPSNLRRHRSARMVEVAAAGVIPRWRGNSKKHCWLFVCLTSICAFGWKAWSLGSALPLGSAFCLLAQNAFAFPSWVGVSRRAPATDSPHAPTAMAKAQCFEVGKARAFFKRSQIMARQARSLGVQVVGTCQARLWRAEQRAFLLVPPRLVLVRAMQLTCGARERYLHVLEVGKGISDVPHRRESPRSAL